MKTVNQWTSLSKLTRALKIAAVFQSGVLFALVLLAYSLTKQDPVVAMVHKSGETVYLKGFRENKEPGKEEVTELVQNFIRASYEWEAFVPEQILTQTRHLVTTGFYERLRHEIPANTKAEFKGKTLRQTVADIHVETNDKQILATFYKILFIDEIPLPIKTEIAFQVTKGPRTDANLAGLYINGIVEHEAK